MPGVPFQRIHSLFQGALIVEIIQDLLIAKALHGYHVSRASGGSQGGYLIHKPLIQHPVYTRFDSAVQPVPVVG